MFMDLERETHIFPISMHNHQIKMLSFWSLLARVEHAQQQRYARLVSRLRGRLDRRIVHRVQLVAERRSSAKDTNE